MQAELEAAYPMLDIQILGVNSEGQEVTSEELFEDNSIPLLQDTDADEDGGSDAWTLWDVEWRDVVVLDGLGQKQAVYNLTDNDLADQENYAALRTQILQVAMDDQRPWSNFDNLLDVNDDGNVTHDDAQRIIDSLNQEGARSLPASLHSFQIVGTPYYDCNMDGFLSPLDALLVLNEVNGFNGDQPSGEGEAAAMDFGPLGLDSVELSQPSAERHAQSDSGTGAAAALAEDSIFTAVDTAAEAGDGGSREQSKRDPAEELPPLLDPLLVDLLLTSL